LVLAAEEEHLLDCACFFDSVYLKEFGERLPFEGKQVLFLCH
jgi:hypothetical protein